MSKVYLQEMITGTEGQVVMINSDGYAEPETRDFGLKPRLLVTVESGAVVTVTDGTKTYTQTSSGAALAFDLDGYGTWTASAAKGGGVTSDTVTTTVDTVKIYPVTLTFFAATITVTVDSGSTVTCAKTGTTTQQKTSTGTVEFTVTETGTYTITATLGDDTADGEVEITANGQSKAITLVYRHIYGVLWDGSSSPAFSRTDDAADFTDPVPYVSGASDYGSPFDDKLPWAGMTRVTDATAGELVAIPKFWYKWTRSGASMKLQIANKQTAGYFVSPAHADRGDGKGERDTVYVGRYHCNSSYKSVTGTPPFSVSYRATARTNIHGLGAVFWQYDFAMYWTIAMLYLVEFASWHSQAKIGHGCGNGSSLENNGLSDSMPYHTGTMKPLRTDFGAGCQYRHIEGLWDGLRDFVDGIYFSGSTIYCINNPADFSDSANGTNVGQRAMTNGLTTSWTNPTLSGFEYALYPATADQSGANYQTYICDGYTYWGGSNGQVLYAGGLYESLDDLPGLFRLAGDKPANEQVPYCGCRLQKLP